MALTKIGSIGINTGIQLAGVTTLSTLNASNNVLSVGGTVNFTGNVSIAGTLTYEDVTNVDSVGLITARSDILVGSGITLSPDGDIFFTGIMTGNGSGLTGVANTDVIFPDKISLGDGTQTDGDQINVGLSSDLRIYHASNVSYMDVTAGGFALRGTGNDNVIYYTSNSDVEIYHDGSKKFETSSSGVTITGTVSATTGAFTNVTGDGSALTGIQVGIQTSVPKSISGITTVLDLSKDDHKITASGITTVDVRGGTESSSHTLRIENSGITTVGFSTYFLFPSGGTPNLPTTDGAISLISFTIHRAGAVGLATQLLAGASVNFS